MTTLSEKIWQRDSARVIMQEARKQFRSGRVELVASRIGMASAHYSLVKRYMNAWWRKPLAVWHMRRAVWHISCALVASPSTNALSADQVDVIATILAKAPRWLGGDRACAMSLLDSALYLSPDKDTMKPHTRALMLITLGEIEWHVGDKDGARRHYTEARKLVASIEAEDSADRERQLVRVLSAVGLFFYDRSGLQGQHESVKMIRRALGLADTVSKDQAEKIRFECSRRRITV